MSGKGAKGLSGKGLSGKGAKGTMKGGDKKKSQGPPPPAAAPVRYYYNCSFNLEFSDFDTKNLFSSLVSGFFFT